jgi:XTP/dITP diphosphohydrolase
MDVRGLEDASVLNLVLATGNAGKVRDFQHVFERAALPVRVHSMAGFGGMPEVDEAEPDFAGNARLKALAARGRVLDYPDCRRYWVLADDSGLSVPALGGAPGVHSARYAGMGASDADNRNLLLARMSSLRGTERSAHFECHLCLMDDAGAGWTFSGRMPGRIAAASAGGHGFGYDPLFIPEGAERTWGEMDPACKNHDSHRARATRAFLDWWKAASFFSN